MTVYKNPLKLENTAGINVPETKRFENIYKTVGGYVQKAGKELANKTKNCVSTLRDVVEESGYLPIRSLPSSVSEGNKKNDWKSTLKKYAPEIVVGVGVPIWYFIGRYFFQNDPILKDLFNMGRTIKWAVYPYLPLSLNNNTSQGGMPSKDEIIKKYSRELLPVFGIDIVGLIPEEAIAVAGTYLLKKGIKSLVK